MKNTIIMLFMLVLIPVAAQENCSAFYPSTLGQTLVIHQLNKKERLSTITEHTITQVTDSTLTFQTKLSDKRAKEIVSGSFNVHCSGGETLLEPESMVTPGLLQQFQNMDYSISGDGIRFPNELSVDQELADGVINMEIDAGIMKMNMTVTMTDRKVVRKEEIIVPAGTFNCYVITYTNTLTMGATKTQYATQWIAKGVGMVQQETRKENGKLVTKSVLHEIRLNTTE